MRYNQCANLSNSLLVLLGNTHIRTMKCTRNYDLYTLKDGQMVGRTTRQTDKKNRKLNLKWFLQIWMNVKSTNTIVTTWHIVAILRAHSIALVFKDLQETVLFVLVWYLTDSTCSNMSQLKPEIPGYKDNWFSATLKRNVQFEDCIILLFRMHKRLFLSCQRALDDEILFQEKKLFERSLSQYFLMGSKICSHIFSLTVCVFRSSQFSSCSLSKTGTPLWTDDVNSQIFEKFRYE